MTWLQYLIRFAVLGITLCSYTCLAINAKDVLNNSKTYSGFVKLHLHQPSGELYLELKKFNQPFLWQTTITQGKLHFSKQQRLTKLVQFEQRSGYVVLRQINVGGLYNSAKSYKNPTDILWQGQKLPGKKTLVNISNLFVLQNHKKASQKKPFNLQNALAFNAIEIYTKNIEINTLITSAKRGMNQVIKHSFMKVPTQKFKPIPLDPLSGFTGVHVKAFTDSGTKMTTSAFQQKFRLSKNQKINFYLAPNIPKKYLKSILEGGAWWQKAFQKIGLNQAIRFKKLPQGVKQADKRYNIIAWHNNLKDTRSQTTKMVDPRTGQIIHATVLFNAHQFLHQTKLARALTSGWKSKEAATTAVEQFIKDSIRLESAFLIGQALGLDINLAGSTHEQPSVMDYSVPEYKIESGEIDISTRLITQLSDWDQASLRFGYAKMTQEQRAALFVERMKTQARYVHTDDPFSKRHAHAYASPFDYGQNAFVSLTKINQVRHVAIDTLSKHALEDAQHESELKQLLPMLLMLDLNQIKAVIAFIGGIEYEITNDTVTPWAWVDPAIQETALQTIVEHLNIKELSIDQQILKRLTVDTQKTALVEKTITTPRNFSEVFNDLNLTEIYCREIFRTLFEPSRLNRVWQASRADGEQLSLDDYLRKILSTTILGNEPQRIEQTAWMRMNFVLIDTLFEAAEHKLISPETKAYLNWHLKYIYNYLEPRTNRATRERSSHYIHIRQMIDNWLKAPLKDKANYRLIVIPAKLRRAY